MRLAPGSFRDPSGFVFERDGALFRQVNLAYREDYDRGIASGLDRALIDEGWLIPHVEVDERPMDPRGAYKVLRPERVPFVSYPYEWSFGQLKAAALLTLGLQRRSMAHGMSLKDASAFNVQFLGHRPIFIDTLSFREYREGEPWVAYRQFCRHFLAPLALMSRGDVRLGQLLRPSLDGIPLDLAGRLLPWRTRLEPGLLIHLHLHARAERSYGGGERESRPRRFSKGALLGLLDSLESAVESLRWEPRGTEWADYYGATNYSDAATEAKLGLVARFLDRVRPSTAWDLGANTGRFSRLAAERGAYTVAMDVDPACVERHYLDLAARGESRILPLRVDLTNPSPSLGWDHDERLSLLDRGPADVVLALAVVHHLAISNNVPLGRVASFLRRAGRSLIVEFVPKEDSQVRRLLSSREDVFDDYHRRGFEAAFAEHFDIERAEPIAESERTLYLMRARGMTGRPWVIHPFLFAPLPILLAQSRNFESVPFGRALGPAALAMAAASACFGALRLARVDGPRAGLVVSAALLLFFGFGHGVRALGRLGVDDRSAREWATLALEGVALGAVAAGVRARPEAARSLNAAANASAAAMAGFWLLGIAGQAGLGGGSRPPRPLSTPVPPMASRPARKPDVYLLVLDAYGRSDVLKEVCGFDNSAFLGRLERKGFFVAHRGTANYCQTALSLASMLNFRYLDELAGSRSPSRLPLRELIRDAAVFRAFRAQGYRLVSFATGFDATELDGADRFEQPPSNLGSFEALLADQTPLWLLTGRRSRHDPFRMHRERILHALDRWPEPGTEGPTFHFAHVLAPHPPFVFEADGRDVSASQGPYTLNDSEGWKGAEGHGGAEDYADRYRRQAAYITSRVEEAVDRILGRPDRPIIIVMGDHGPGSRFESGSDRPNDLRERMSNLNALYLPDDAGGMLDDAITPVNTFRVVLDRTFGAGLGRLPDRNYYSPFLTPYVFTEVTAELGFPRPGERAP